MSSAIRRTLDNGVLHGKAARTKKESNLVHPQLCLEKGNQHIPAPTTSCWFGPVFAACRAGGLIIIDGANNSIH